MSFELDVSLKLGDRTICTCFQTGVGITALFGPSGAGKTSVLNMVTGLLRPDRGKIVIGGTTLFDSAQQINMAPELRRCGYVFQDRRLFPHRSVRANLTYGTKSVTPAHSILSFNETIALLGIGHLLDRRPRTLSGGEAQRVAIGRALLSGPRFLVMDEPLAALDAPRRAEIIRLIEHIRDQLALPILYVSHDRAEVERLAEHIVELA